MRCPPEFNAGINPGVTWGIVLTYARNVSKNGSMFERRACVDSVQKKKWKPMLWETLGENGELTFEPREWNRRDAPN